MLVPLMTQSELLSGLSKQSSSHVSSGDRFSQVKLMLVLPAPTTHDRNGQGDNITSKSKLRNKVITHLSEMELGWDPSVAETTGKTFVDELTLTLWRISPFHMYV